MIIRIIFLVIYNVDDDQKNEMKAIGGDLMIESIRSWELEKTMK